jgi:hypothetical protein
LFPDRWSRTTGYTRRDRPVATLRRASAGSDTRFLVCMVSALWRSPDGQLSIRGHERLVPFSWPFLTVDRDDTPWALSASGPAPLVHAAYARVLACLGVGPASAVWARLRRRRRCASLNRPVLLTGATGYVGGRIPRVRARGSGIRLLPHPLHGLREGNVGVTAIVVSIPLAFRLKQAGRKLRNAVPLHLLANGRGAETN